LYNVSTVHFMSPYNFTKGSMKNIELKLSTCQCYVSGFQNPIFKSFGSKELYNTMFREVSSNF